MMSRIFGYKNPLHLAIYKSIVLCYTALVRYKVLVVIVLTREKVH